MRGLSVSRLANGLPYILLGIFMTFCLLFIHNNFSSDSNQIRSIDSLQIVSHNKRHLENYPCSENEAIKKDQERETMIKLMKTLLETLNKKIDLDHSMDQITPLGNNQLKGWTPHRDPKAFLKNLTLSHFKMALSAPEKEVLYNTLLKLESVSKEYNFTWMLYSGTLLGSWRHHDMIPWDDDFDIFMNYTQREEIKAILSNLGPEYGFFEAGSRMKFWASEGTIKSSKYPWKWPYLDISFFKENKTHICDGSMEDDYGDKLYMYHKSIVFPLHKRPMGNYFFPAPRDSFSHIKLTYKAGGMGMCWTTHYSHRTEKLTGEVHKIMCKELKNIYPFVYRKVAPQGKGLQESLRLGNKEIHNVFVQEPTYAITDPFSVSLM